MKKSKILIPAFAVLALSVGASVTGTVAWFSANRAVSFSSTFGVVDSEGALDIKVTPNDRTGTIVTSNNVTVDGKLTHGSYNALKDASGSLYVANTSEPYENGKFTIDSYADLGNIASTANSATGESTPSKWKAGEDANGKIWYGVSWTAELSIKVSGIEGENFLFLDLNKTTATGKGEVNKGFRIAVMGGDIDGANALVLANDDVNKHVSGTSKGDNKTEFGRFERFGSTYTRVVDGTSKKTIKDDKGYIATFKKTNDADTEMKIALTFVAWYEGEDPAVASGANMDHIENITATLSFYARRSNLA